MITKDSITGLDKEIIQKFFADYPDGFTEKYYSLTHEALISLSKLYPDNEINIVFESHYEDELGYHTKYEMTYKNGCVIYSDYPTYPSDAEVIRYKNEMAKPYAVNTKDPSKIIPSYYLDGEETLDDYIRFNTFTEVVEYQVNRANEIISQLDLYIADMQKYVSNQPVKEHIGDYFIDALGFKVYHNEISEQGNRRFRPSFYRIYQQFNTNDEIGNLGFPNYSLLHEYILKRSIAKRDKMVQLIESINLAKITQ